MSKDVVDIDTRNLVETHPLMSAFTCSSRRPDSTDLSNFPEILPSFSLASFVPDKESLQPVFLNGYLVFIETPLAENGHTDISGINLHDDDSFLTFDI